MRGLLIVDVQNDFTEGGALGVEGGTEVARHITSYLHEHADEYDVIIASRDWHDGEGDNGGHFALDAEPNFVDTWPVHCVAGSFGAEYHPELNLAEIDIHVKKGQGEPSYSMFEGITEDGYTVQQVLDERGITHVDVVGIATDHCVRASALDALAGGQKVTILTDMVAAVTEETGQIALDELMQKGAELHTSS
jgi:nicotinamidase/pyrazinamidase